MSPGPHRRIRPNDPVPPDQRDNGSETLDRTVETFDAVEEAQGRFRELTGEGPEEEAGEAP